MTNWLKKIFSRVSGRSEAAPEQNNQSLAERMNRVSAHSKEDRERAREIVRNDTARETAREMAQRKRRNTTSPGYGSNTRRSGTDDTYIHTSLWHSAGDSGSYGSGGDSGGSCGGGDGGGGGGGGD